VIISESVANQFSLTISESPGAVSGDTFEIGFVHDFPVAIASVFVDFF
jgi:hypothetical protein